MFLQLIHFSQFPTLISSVKPVAGDNCRAIIKTSDDWVSYPGNPPRSGPKLFKVAYSNVYIYPQGAGSSTTSLLHFDKVTSPQTAHPSLHNKQCFARSCVVNESPNGYSWKCGHCNTRTRTSIGTESFSARCILGTQQIVMMMFYWLYKVKCKHVMLFEEINSWDTTVYYNCFLIEWGTWLQNAASRTG